MTSSRTTARPRTLLSALASLRWLFIFLGLLAFGDCAYDIVGAHYFQATERRQFEASSSPAPRRPSLPALPVYFPGGSPIGELEIPRLAMKDVVIEGVTAADLRKAVGHIPGTAFPWQNGNVVVSAHRTTFFRPLRKIRPGDLIILRTRYGLYSYMVKFTQIVKPTEVQVLDAHSYPSLTLTTCYPFYYVGSAPDRFIVVAARTKPQNPRT